MKMSALSDVSQLKLSDQGREVFAEREGMRLTAYKDSVAINTVPV